MTKTGLLTNASDFADDLLGGHPGTDLRLAGHACLELASTLPDPSAASGVISTILWDVFCHSRALIETLGRSPDWNTPGAEAFVIRHPLFVGPSRHDLLILDTERAHGEVSTASIPADDAWISEGIERYLAYGAKTSIDFPVEEWDQMIREAIAAQEFQIIIAGKPPVIRLSVRGLAAPSPALDVRRRQDAEEYGSVGVFAEDGQRLVCTTALHVLQEEEGETVPLAREVWIGGAPGAVISTHEISDSAIVALDHPEEMDLSSARPLLGPLSGVTPREGQPMTFEGAGSPGPLHPYVTGWSRDLLNVKPYNQAKVLTTPDTTPGDSGAALFDPDDFLIGFSFDRSEFNAIPEFSSWIWADSVVSIHHLEAFDLVAG